MSFTEIFHNYFKNKILLCVGLGGAVLIIRYLSGYHTSFTMVAIVFLVMLLIAFIIGFQNYQYYENELPKRSLALLNLPPLKEFAENGFSIDQNDKLEGYINNYQVFISPFVTYNDRKYLVILIPLQLQKDIEDYFEKGLDHGIHLSMSNNVVFARRVLEDYDNNFDYQKLLDLINSVTKDLAEKNLLPVEVDPAVD